MNMDCSAAQTRNLKTATQSKLKIVSCHFAPVIIIHVKKSNSNFFYLVLVFIAIKCNQNMKKIHIYMLWLQKDNTSLYFSFFVI